MTHEQAKDRERERSEGPLMPGFGEKTNPRGPLTDWSRDGIRPSDQRLTLDEKIQEARQRGYDIGWANAWEIVTGGTAVELPWPERLRLIKRICEGIEVQFGDAGGTVIVYLGRRVPDDEQTAELLPVPEYDGASGERLAR